MVYCVYNVWGMLYVVECLCSLAFRERCRLYQEKYYEKLHSLNPSNTLLTEIQVSVKALETCTHTLTHSHTHTPASTSFAKVLWLYK